MNENKPFFHGTNTIVQRPNLKKSRQDIDFGIGFYLTQDIRMAKKWACGKTGTPHVNEYQINFSGLRQKVFSLDEEWLHYVAGNRTGKIEDYPLFIDDSEYDIIIGPVADDNLFTTIDLYMDGLLSAKDTIRILNCMNYSEQIVLKTQKAIEQTTFFTCKTLEGAELTTFQTQYKMDKIEKIRKTKEIMTQINRGR